MTDRPTRRETDERLAELAAQREAMAREALRQQGSLRNIGYNERHAEGNSPDESGVTLEEYRAAGDRIDRLRREVLAKAQAGEK